MPNPNAHAGTPDADDWTPRHQAADRQERAAAGKWTVRRKLDDEGQGESQSTCCGRARVDHMELVWVTGPLRAALQRVQEQVPGALGKMNVSPDTQYLCGDCLRKLRGRWRVLGRQPVVDRPGLMFALGAPREAVERARMKRDLDQSYGVTPEPRGGVAMDVLEQRGFTSRRARQMPANPNE